MASFKPTLDRVLIKVLSAEKLSKGGIVIPDSAQEKPCEATVVAVGPGKLTKKGFEATTVKPGDTVLYGRLFGTEIEIEGVPHLVLREEELFAVIKKAAS